MSAMGRCSARTTADGIRSDQCKRPGKVTHEGRVYCRQHDPVALAERKTAREQAWQAKWAERDAINVEGKALVARLGCGMLYGARAIAITFEDAERLIAERDANGDLSAALRELFPVAANARLIAAAPDLLAALKELRAEVSEGIGDSGHEELKHGISTHAASNADAAIRKAESR